MKKQQHTHTHARAVSLALCHVGLFGVRKNEMKITTECALYVV